MARKKKIKQGRPVGSFNQYPINMSATIRDIIEKKNRFTHQREIVTELSKRVGKVEDPISFAKKASVLIYSLKNRKLITQYSASGSTRMKFYGNPKWLKRNKPIEGFAPNVLS